MTSKKFNEILVRIRRGETTPQDADMLREMMHAAWAEGKRRRKGVSSD